MTQLPVVSGKEAVRAFERLGYEQVRQKGSHVFIKCEGRASLSVPLNNPVKRGLLRSLVKDSGFTIEELRTRCRLEARGALLIPAKRSPAVGRGFSARSS